MNNAFRAIVLCCSAAANAQQLPVDAPVPQDFKERLYLSSADVAGVRSNMERVVGYFAFIKPNGKIAITGRRPASAKGATRVALMDGKPAYDGVMTTSQQLGLAIPVLSVSWSNNQRGQVTITDTAQFSANGDPEDSDWQSLAAPAAPGGRWVFVDSATVSVVQTTVLSEKGGMLDGLLKTLAISGKNYQALNSTASSMVVSLFVKENPLTIAAMPPATHILGVAGTGQSVKQASE